MIPKNLEFNYGSIIKKKYKVQSQSSSSFYEVVHTSKNELFCNCIAGGMGKTCAHMKLILCVMTEGLTYVPLYGYCEYCEKGMYVTEHHLVRQSQGGAHGKTIWLCFPCHDLATNNKEFEEQLLRLYGGENTGKIKRFRTDKES